ncbi:MAG: PTS transporter subunit EIIC [Longicatena sp.]
MFDKFNDILGIIAEKVDGNKYLSVIKNTFTIYMPFVIVGSFALLFNTLLCSTTVGLAQFEALSFLTKLSPAFTAIKFATMSAMTLAIVFILAMQLAKRNKVNEHISGLVALAAYITVVPEGIKTVVDGVESMVAGLPVAAIDASGLFVGMILTVLVVELFSKLCKIEKLKIKMPPQVPGAIATSFNTLIPIFITLIVFSIGGVLFQQVSGSYINEYIYMIVQKPLEVIFQSPAGIIAIVIFMQFFWLLGIHGGLIISPIRNPLMISALAANVAAVDAGLLPTQPITTGFWNVFVTVGGAGITLALILALLIFSKRDDQKMVAKLGFFPGLCGISEPIVFGLPLVMNPVFAIPFLLGSGLATAIALFSVNIGFIAPSIVDVPFGVPIFLNAFIGYGFNGVLVQVAILAACFLLYLPFVKISNKQYAKQQAKELENKEVEAIPADTQLS